MTVDWVSYYPVVAILIFLGEVTASATFDAAFCAGQRNGLYADPIDCAGFYSCFNSKTYHFTCPPGLRFDYKTQVCTWKAVCINSAGANSSPLNETAVPQASADIPLVPLPSLPREAAQCTSVEDVRCADGSTCIPRQKVCDTVRDCPEGGTDEYGCDLREDPYASQPCKKDTCALPACFCSNDGAQIPGGVALASVPQMVLLAFPGALNSQNHDLIRNLFLPTRLNPNQCPIHGTFFVSHEYSDYSHIEKFYKSGHEIALSTLSRDRETPYWWTTVSSYKDWGIELQSQREILHHFAHVPLTETRGGQAPNLHLGSNTQFAAMQDFGFEWDGSITVPSTSRPVWPYKLAFSVPHTCHQSGCPTRPYNVWEVPINQLIDSQGFGCPSLGSCHNDDLKTAEEVLQWLLKKFNRHYTDNRAPLVLVIDPNWLQENFDALSRFIETLITKPEQDTYFVTYHQLVQWIQSPTPIELLADFVPWACDEEAAGFTCEALDCDLAFVHGGTRRFRACVPACPASFPWKDNIKGEKTVDPVLKRYVNTVTTPATTISPQ
ncbi:hypothetical protein RvY_08411 [Ramazzottius varieornatus]|uniref:Chitin-binding type-2 domain-containing protein n=1 Tax=Ramazzottius varieornatus TaxID=947166 RepID=A0A1D1VAC1_RAMVA|nr:hypothetical protein RvY_08411 [Ramazzottius varieornatus]